MRPILAVLFLLPLSACLDSRSGTVADTGSTADVDALEDASDTLVSDTAAPLDTVADTTAGDTSVVDTSPADDVPIVDVAVDTVPVVDTTTPDPCAGPLRITPRYGPSIGGTRVVAEGMQFYIGALTWMMKVGDAPATEMLYSEEIPFAPCQIAFDTPPNPPGTYAVYVYYGWGEPHEPDQLESGAAGTFTYGE